MGRALGDPGLKPTVRVGEAAMREVAAYLLDHEHFARVPATALVKVSSLGVFCGWYAFDENLGKAVVREAVEYLPGHELTTRVPATVLVKVNLLRLHVDCSAWFADECERVGLPCVLLANQNLSADAKCCCECQVSHTIFHVAPSKAPAASAPASPGNPAPASGLSAAMRSRCAACRLASASTLPLAHIEGLRCSCIMPDLLLTSDCELLWLCQVQNACRAADRLCVLIARCPFVLLLKLLLPRDCWRAVKGVFPAHRTSSGELWTGPAGPAPKLCSMQEYVQHECDTSEVRMQWCQGLQ